jgi:hypothetical protein
MPQVSYGVIDDGREHREGAGVEDLSTAQTPLLRHSSEESPRIYLSSSEGSAGIMSSVGNLANTILGTGVLAFPLVCCLEH